MVFFHEEQRYRQKWLWAIILVPDVFLVSLFGYGMARQLFFGRPWGTRPMSDTALFLVGSGLIIFVLALTYLFYCTRLVTEVRDDGISIRFIPFIKKVIAFDTIKTCRARTYNPIREYGGWGIRYGKSGRAYNVIGNRGVQLEFHEGKPLLIGSQFPEDLAREIAGRVKRLA